MKGSIDVHPVFLAMGRPPMILGVTVDYLGLNSILSLVLFMLLHKPFIAIFLGLSLHITGWIVCLIDPYIFNVLSKKLDFLTNPNQSQWGVKSYAPY